MGMIEFKDVSFSYPNGFSAVEHVSFEIGQGEKILVLDEPTAGQDLHGIKCLENILSELEKKGTTVITITHDMEFVVNNFPRVFVMAHKNLLKVGTAREIFRDDALLEESMLKKPYVSSLAAGLGIEEDILYQDELARYFVK